MQNEPDAPAVLDDQPIRVLLADDHASMRDALNFLLEPINDIQVVGEAADGVAALQQVNKLAPDVVLMDINMPRMDGIEATRRITQTHPAVHVVGMMMHGDSVRTKAMQNVGAAVCVNKGDAPDKMIQTIRGLMTPAPCERHLL